MASPHVRTRRWTRVEYARLIDLRLLDEDEPVELVDGELVCKEPQCARHAAAVLLVAEALRRAFGAGWQVRIQMPIALGSDSRWSRVARGTSSRLLDPRRRRPAN